MSGGASLGEAVGDTGRIEFAEGTGKENVVQGANEFLY